MVDNIENKLFRYITPSVQYHTNTASMVVWLEKGNHEVRV